MPADLMIDLSSNNPAPNLKELWAKGYRVLGLKATESTNYTWSEGLRFADAWHKLGGTVWHYHFAQPGNPEAQARHFLSAIRGHTAKGDKLVLDAEVAGVGGQFSDAFFNVVHAASPLGEEIYGTPYFIRDSGIRPKHGQGLWLADYAAHPAFIPPGWRKWDAWQFTRTSTVSGETGHVDQSHLAKGEWPKPAPKPAPKKPVAPRSRWWKFFHLHWFSWGHKNN